MTEPEAGNRWVAPRPLQAAAGWSWRLLIITFAVGAVVYVSSILSVVVIPMILGLFLAAALDRPVRMLHQRGWRPAPAAAVCVLALIAVLGGVMWIVVHALVEPWTAISGPLGEGLDTVQAEVGDIAGEQGFDAAGTVRSNGGEVLSVLLNGTLTIVAGATMLLSTTFLALFVTFFYLKDGPRLWNGVAQIGGRQAPKVDRVGRAMWEKLRGYLRGTATVALVDAVGIGLGAWVLGVPSPGAIFALTLVLAFIPYFGAVGAGLVACILAVSTGGPSLGVAMLVVVLLVQQLEGIVLQPLLVGNAVSLHPLVVALGVIAGGAIAGIAGMFVAVPVIAAVSAAVHELRATPPVEVAPTPEGPLRDGGSGLSGTVRG